MLLALFLLTKELGSQTPRASKYEWIWALGHPVAAIKIHRISKHCDRYYLLASEDKRLDVYSMGGKLDAYRHLFYFAAFAQHVKIKKIKKLGRAHERSNYAAFLRSETEFGSLADSVSAVMDLYNNELGMQVGATHKTLSIDSLSEVVISEILKGHAYILKRNAEGKLVSCTNEPIDLNRVKRCWGIAYCLISSMDSH